jgi:hypothetical protein
MSLKLNKFLFDFGEYKASLMTNFVPFGNMNIALPVPSIRSAGPEIVFITPLVGFKSVKYLLLLRIV